LYYIVKSTWDFRYKTQVTKLFIKDSNTYKTIIGYQFGVVIWGSFV